MGIKVIVTGATGMVGEGVLHECLNHPMVESVLVLGRRSCGTSHSKLAEVIVSDFFDLSALEGKLGGYDACLFCLGVSSIGMNEQDYTKLTHTLTHNFAQTFKKASPQAVFCYISGASTDSSEKGRSMWARDKGRTENDLLKLFNKAYMFRPGYMHPTPGLKNTLKFYRYIGWMYPFLRVAFRGSVSTLAELGQAMIIAVLKGSDKQVLEVKDIVKLAKS